MADTKTFKGNLLARQEAGIMPTNEKEMGMDVRLCLCLCICPVCFLLRACLPSISFLYRGPMQPIN